MKSIINYKVLDVRECERPVWHSRTNTVGSEHYYVFILEGLESKKRKCLTLEKEDIIDYSNSEHQLVVPGDIVQITSETSSSFCYGTKNY